MINFLIVIDTLIAIALIIVILLQRSEGGVLGLGSSKMGGVFTAKGMGDALSKITTILGAALFIVTIALAIIISNKYNNTNSNLSKPKEIQEKEVKTIEAKKIDENKIKEETNNK